MTFITLRYSVADLGTLGGEVSLATALNDRGEVVGNSTTTSGPMHGFVWQNGRMRDLGTLRGPGSRASDINDAGAVVGQAQVGRGPGSWRAFLWRNGRMARLGTGNNLSSAALGINTAGVIDGSYTSEDGCVYACCWDAHGMHRLGGQAQSGASADRIDDQGDVVGATVRVASRYASEACIWRRGRLSLLPLPRYAVWSAATAADGRGVVVGWVEDERQRDLPCAWQLGRCTTFRLLSDGGSGGGAASINQGGTVVGYIGASEHSRAAAWLSGRLVDLNNTITMNSHWTLDGASCINSRGQIVGWGRHYGHRRAFLLTPDHGGTDLAGWGMLCWRPA